MSPDGPVHPTKGRTSAGRLRLLDTWLRLRPPDALLEPAANGNARVVVDLGFGESPATSLEWLKTLRAVGMAPDRLIAVEREPHRVASARRVAGGQGLEIREGGFDLPLREDEEVRAVRVMNVLRGYPLEAAREAHRLLGRTVPDGCRVWEGSADPAGHLLTCHLLRAEKSTLRREGLLLATDFRRGFAPLQLRDWLPRDLRRSVRPGHPLHAFFTHWTAAFEVARAAGAQTSAERFTASVMGLGERVEGVCTDPDLLEAGLLVWTPPGGIPP